MIVAGVPDDVLVLLDCSGVSDVGSAARFKVTLLGVALLIGRRAIDDVMLLLRVDEASPNYQFRLPLHALRRSETRYVTESSSDWMKPIALTYGGLDFPYE